MTPAARPCPPACELTACERRIGGAQRAGAQEVMDYIGPRLEAGVRSLGFIESAHLKGTPP
jgi:hypothetical protein